jgi:hypothetical protein
VQATNQLESETSLPTKAPFAAPERVIVTQHLENITNDVVLAIRDVMKVAQDLETLVVQNAARVKVELTEHMDLASAAKSEAQKLGGILLRLRTTQAELITQRSNGRDDETH